MYSAVFLYEDREGKIQNIMAQWWVSVDDARIVAHSRAAAFLQGVARLTVGVFDRAFGNRLLSLRFAGVSFCLSVASFFLVALFGAIRSHQSVRGPLFGAACAVAFALLPALDPGRWVVRLWGLCLLVFIISPATSAFLLFAYLTRGAGFVCRLVGYSGLALGVSFVCDVSYVALTRWMLKRVSATGRMREAALMVAVNLLILFLLFLGPIKLGVKVFQYWQGAGAIIVVSLLLNAIDLFAGSAALLLGVSLLIHRLFWPILEKPLYAIQRYQVIRNKKLLWGRGWRWRSCRRT
jgi:hypothetical protein